MEREGPDDVIEKENDDSDNYFSNGYQTIF